MRRIIVFLKKSFNKQMIITTVLALFVGSLFLTTILLGRSVGLPTKISTMNGLDEIRENLDGYYLITNDLYMSQYVDEEGNQKQWIPIGTKDKPFTGKIDFNGYMISGLCFSEDYINSEIHSEYGNDILLGFLGFSQGILIHTKFYRPIIPNFTELNNTEKRIIFGTACAINEGYVTSCSIELGGSTLFTGRNIIFGTLVGENKKQLLNDICVNSVAVNCYGEGIIGGIVGISHKDSNNFYLVRRGYTTINCFSESSIVVGGISGYDFGSKFSNVYSGPANLNQQESISISTSIYSKYECIVGGLIGCSSGDGFLSLENGCSSLNLSVKDSLVSCNMGGIIGRNNISKFSLESSVSDVRFISPNLDASRCGVIVGRNNGMVVSNNSFFISRDQVLSEINYNYCHVSSFDDLTLSQLHWQSEVRQGCWHKTNTIFYLSL